MEEAVKSFHPLLPKDTIIRAVNELIDFFGANPSDGLVEYESIIKAGKERFAALDVGFSMDIFVKWLKFFDVNKDNKWSRAEILTMYGAICLFAAIFSEKDEYRRFSYIDHLFRTFDRDKKGYLSGESMEFFIDCIACEMSISKEDARLLIDTNADNTIDIEEFRDVFDELI
ncbi:hypothetical protein ADUPG1_009405 [Aduncisulcus paluster]|uniref:EF-hand domain-containing protein n=1 Tax=Aduncisulcus paluster TaxID=2918883 RepID=A0ABQ5KVF3_9EUKA|nr:hypothetical protein ADUPG1_009405 [Aduncisulcus paluster]